MGITVSVVVCTHNRSDALRDSFYDSQSALKALPFEIEYIIVANGCSDGTGAAVKEMGLSEPRIKYIDLPNPGKAEALRVGIVRARGKYIIILDDDNTLLKGWLEVAVETFESNGSLGLLGCASVLPKGRTVPSDVLPYLRHYAVGSQDTSSIGGERVHVWGAGTVLLAEPLRRWFNGGHKLMLDGRVGGDLIAGEDTEISIIYRIWGYEVRTCPHVGIVHKISPDRFTVSVLARLWRSEGAAFQIYRNYYYDQAFIRNESQIAMYIQIIRELIYVVAALLFMSVLCRRPGVGPQLRRMENLRGRLSGLSLFIAKRNEMRMQLRHLRLI